MGLRLLGNLQGLRRRWNRLRFRLIEVRGLRRWHLGSGVSLNVPVRVRGCGELVIGEGTSLGFRGAMRLGSGEILIQPRSADACISIGQLNAFSNNVCIVANASIEIGDGCQIGDMVCIYDCDFHELSAVTRNRSVGIIRPVKIGNNVWLGSRVMILKGVTIGDNSVIAAMSVVTKPIRANCIAAGNPARVVRFFTDAEMASAVRPVSPTAISEVV